MKTIITIVFVSTMSIVQAQTYLAGKRPGQIEELKKKATLKFEIRDEKQKVINTFTGFMYGQEGRFVTVHHSFAEDFNFQNTKNKLMVENSDGLVPEKVIIEGCSNKNNVDICTGRMEGFPVKSFFEPSKGTRYPGELFTSIGHCKAENRPLEPFNVKKGTLKKVTENYQQTYNASGDRVNLSTRLLEGSLPKCTGDSGGALIAPFTGALIGMFSFNYKEHYFAIDVSEIVKLVEANKGKVLSSISVEKAEAKAETKDECADLKVGSREYENCRDLQ